MRCRNIIGGIILSGLITACATENEMPLSQRLPENLKVLSVYGEKHFLNGYVEFSGWESDSPQTLFLTDGSKTYLLAYVLPEKLIEEVWQGNTEVIQKLSYFTPKNGYVRIDERTTALNLVLIAPPYFWMFTPRAIAFAAGHVVTHPEFDKLVQYIQNSAPGELTSGKYQDVFSLAQKIASDVRERITPADMLAPSIVSRISEKQEGCGDGRIAKMEDAPGTKVKFIVQHMVFYGGGIFNGIDPTKINDIRRYFLLKAQEAKVDLSIDNIIRLNFINPRVETEVDFQDYNRHAVRLEKGFELSTSIITDPIKRIGLIANFGRIVKFVIEIAVPNIAACIPDGDTWGYVVVTTQNLFTSGDINDIQSVFKSSWDEILRLIVSSFTDQNSWIYRIINKVGFASCAYQPNFIISQIAGFIRNFPIVKLYDAITRYIPFGYELFTKPRTAVYGAQNGAPITGEQIIVSIDPVTQATSPGIIKIETMGPECRGNCYIRLQCPIFGVHELKTYLACGLNQKNFEVPYNFYGNGCRLILAVAHTQTEGGFLGIGGTQSTFEITTSEYTINIRNCPECAYNPSANPRPSGGGGGQEEGGGCSSTSPYSLYTLFALIVLVIMRSIKSVRNF
ncbi:MAG: hypothetical protein NZ927_01965 [Candidatus Calescibacterium sp.]|nr:hypothetical protein [Candidatus Calescibacterium sp.]MDW8086830.1 hypothetical protein [Candidatus Calescibacterium sp.]